MKNINKYLIVSIVALLTYSCQEKLEVYDNETNRIGFDFERYQDSMSKYTFVYYPSTRTRDTLWVKLNTLGYCEDFDRGIKIVQIPTGDDKLQAVAGKHYVAFDDPEIAKYFVVPANANTVSIPIIFLRDPSLKEGRFYINLEVQKNDYFSQSYPRDNNKLIEVSDIITKPKYWNGQVEAHFGWFYGDAKYQFMIDVATWTLDEKWFETNFLDHTVVDMGYTDFLSQYFSEKLRQTNKKRQAEGKGLLREKPASGETEGKLVQFVKSQYQPLPVI